MSFSFWSIFTQMSTCLKKNGENKWVTGETSHYEAWTLDARYNRTKIDYSSHVVYS